MGGLASERVTLSNSKEANPGEYVREVNGIDFFRVGFEGHITTPQIFDLSPISHAGINTLPRSIIVNVGGSAATPEVYFMLSGSSGTAPRVVEVELSAATYQAIVTDISAHAGHDFTTIPSTSTGYWGEDVIIYRVGPTNYLFYTWNDNVDGDVGRATVAGASPDDDFMSQASGGPAGYAALYLGVPHIFAEGADRKLYVTNRNYVSSFDGDTGANGTFDVDAYNLGPGWIATDVKKFGNLLAIASVNMVGTIIPIGQDFAFSAGTMVTLWNMTESGLGLVRPVNDNGVTAIFPYFNNLYAFSNGKGSTGKISKLVGERFEVIWESSVYNNKVDPRSIDVYKGLIYFVSGTNILAFDPKREAVHHVAVLNDGTNDVSSTVTSGASGVGFLKNTYATDLRASGLFSATYQAVTLRYTTGSYSTANHDLRTKLYQLPYNSNITKIQVFFSQLASGGSARLSLFEGYDDSSIGGAADLLDETISNAVHGAIDEYEITGSALGNIQLSSFYMNIRNTGQVSIREILIFWEPSR